LAQSTEFYPRNIICIAIKQNGEVRVSLVPESTLHGAVDIFMSQKGFV